MKKLPSRNLTFSSPKNSYPSPNLYLSGYIILKVKMKKLGKIVSRGYGS